MGKKTWHATHSETTGHIWPGFFGIEIHWKNRLNTSFDAEFNALKEYLIQTEKIDLENRENKQETNLDDAHSQRIPHIWRVFFQITIHCKKVLDTSFDREFNALKECGILIEKLDLENWEKKKKWMECYTLRDSSSYLTKFFKIKIHWKNRLNRSFDAEFNALPDYGIIIEKIDLENGEEKDGMLHIQGQFLIFDEITTYCKKTFSASFDREFDALKEYVILIGKIDLENGEKKKKNMECSTFTDSSSYLTKFFQD